MAARPEAARAARALTISRRVTARRHAAAVDIEVDGHGSHLISRLEWLVRGTLQSSRAVRELMTARERGDDLPLVDGKRPDVEEASPV